MNKLNHNAQIKAFTSNLRGFMNSRIYYKKYITYAIIDYLYFQHKLRYCFTIENLLDFYEEKK
jgi:hypothetical protein